MMQLPPNLHRLGLPWSGQLNGNPPRATEIAAISLNEQPLLHFTFAHAKSPFLPHNKANNKQDLSNRTIIPQSNNSRNLGQP